MSNDLDGGWAALGECRWAAAKTCFGKALQSEATPEAFEGLSWAAWWTDDAEAMFGAREQAFRLYKERGDDASAARMATWLAVDQIDFHGAVSVASGWLERAARLLEPLPDGPDHGWCAVHRGYVSLIKGDPTAAEAHGVRAAELGRRFGVPDLEMLGLALQGTTLVSRARVEDGMRCLDEATALALSGEASIPISSAWTCCFLVTACTRVLDFERAFEWCDRIAEFAERYDSRYMLGFCRAEYATIHLWRGDWDLAEHALGEAIEALTISRAPMVGGALAQLAELRRCQGKAEESAQLLDQAGSSLKVQLCRAELALDRGDASEALELAARALRSTDDAFPVSQVAGLGVLFRAQLACGDLDGASASVARLSETARTVGTSALLARAALARGMLSAARSEHDLAKPLFEDAIDRFDRCGARFDAARGRIVLAQTLSALDRPADAMREARAGHACLQALGARTEAARAAEIIGASEPRPSAAASLISPREKDVLGLLAKGLTNREISKRLFISEHTVHRHVTNILRKLDVPSRAAAAVQGIHIGLVAPPED